jgi:hypothetical protein
MYCATDFDHSRIAPNEAIESCDVFLVQAIHGFRKAVTVTSRDTPVAKTTTAWQIY